jgi:hypothetical protein
MIRENLTAFLQEQLQANRTRHSGRTLYQHLVGTHDLLKAWGADEDLCHAGLFHSIYGTRRFRHRSWPLSDRNTIKELIGFWPETLVYMFCVIDRPRALFDGGNSILVYDHHLHRDTLLTWRMRRKLLELEAANLLEQNGSSRWLERLLQKSISDAAKAAIRQRLNSEASHAEHEPEATTVHADRRTQS